jgi:hypothetical protein
MAGHLKIAELLLTHKTPIVCFLHDAGSNKKVVKAINSVVKRAKQYFKFDKEKRRDDNILGKRFFTLPPEYAEDGFWAFDVGDYDVGDWCGCNAIMELHYNPKDQHCFLYLVA